MAVAAEVLPLPLAAVLVAADPPNPLYTAEPPAAVDTADAPVAPPAVAVLDIVAFVEVLARVGFCAPQG